MEHISVFQLNDPKSMNFFYNFRIFCISCELDGDSMIDMNLDHPIPRLNMPKYSYLPITSEKIQSGYDSYVIIYLCNIKAIKPLLRSG